MASSNTSEPRESLYTILNLPVSASQDEIRHRYKELAVVFHPDRQSHRDESTLKTAERHFRDIQRAHEILTNPELRQVYDTLGEAGITAYRAVGNRYSSPDKLRAHFERLVEEAKGSSQRGGSSSGQLTCAFDFTDALRRGHPPGVRGLLGRMKGIKSSYMDVAHSVEISINNNTQASLSGAISAVRHPGAPRDYGNIFGTIRHQFSPRIHFEATTHLLRSHATVLKALYRDDENEVSVRTSLSIRNNIPPPPLTIQLQRKLFVSSLIRGVLRFYLEDQPRFSAGLVSPSRPPGNVEWRTGLELARYPTLNAEIKKGALSGGFCAAFSIKLGFTSLVSTVTGQWSDSRDNAVSVKIGAGRGNVFMNITFELLGQRILVPLILSYEVDEMIGICALLVPSALAILAHNFIVKPRVRLRRISKLRAIREAQQDSISRHKQEASQTIALLCDGAQRRVEHERAIDGLVIVSAVYSTSGDDGDILISVDVTVPMQAQVHESQLTIPGGRSKIPGLLGFYDPSPGSRKRLKIEYLFHGRLHVADVGDFAQVVLPLRGHLVE